MILWRILVIPLDYFFGFLDLVVSPINHFHI